ncbi:MAG: aldolase [Euzebyales bacterium]|nr:aldolase [Euzebyales bacterium]
MPTTTLKRRLLDGGIVVGTMVFEFRTPGVAAVCAAAGADFVLFDQEATGCSVETLGMLMATARGVDTVPLVRVPATQPHLLSGPLDVGAGGLMVPMVESRAQAEAIVDAAKYPPLGNRGVIAGLAAAGYRAPDDIGATLAEANTDKLLIAQIESGAGVERVEEIAAVDGIDVLWLGHLDLTVSLGIPGQFDHPAFTDAVSRIVAAARAAGKPAAAKVGGVEEARRRIDQGFSCICYGDDVKLLRDGLRAGVDAVRR